MVGLIEGLERQLSSSAPKTARMQLGEVRECIGRAASAKARKSCERMLDTLAESSPYFKGAARRHVGEQVDIILDGTERVLGGMARIARARGNRKGERGITKILVDFCRKRRKPLYGSVSQSVGDFVLIPGFCKRFLTA